MYRVEISLWENKRNFGGLILRKILHLRYRERFGSSVPVSYDKRSKRQNCNINHKPNLRLSEPSDTLDIAYILERSSWDVLQRNRNAVCPLSQQVHGASLSASFDRNSVGLLESKPCPLRVLFRLRLGMWVPRSQKSARRVRIVRFGTPAHGFFCHCSGANKDSTLWLSYLCFKLAYVESK